MSSTPTHRRDDEEPADLWSDVADRPESAWSRWARRSFLLLLIGVVVAGLLGYCGPSVGTVSDDGDVVDLTVDYPSVTRAGQPAPLDVRVTREGGFDGPVTLRVCRDLVDLLDFQNWYPNPSAETGDPRRVDYEFDPPGGDVFEVHLDARSQPGVLFRSVPCALTVLDGDTALASVSFTTRRLP